MKNFIKYFFIFVFCILFFIFIQVAEYLYTQKQNEKSVDFCKQNYERCDINVNPVNSIVKYNPTNSVANFSNSCYCKMYNLLLPQLLVYKTFKNGQPTKFLRVSWDSYIVPISAIEHSDAIVTYGVLKDILFEDNISKLYKKHVYTYDCGVKSIDGIIDNNPYVTFGSECIGTDKFILKEFGQKSSKKIHSLGQKLNELNLQNKKIYLKMDIAGAEIDVLPDIVNYADNLTGMSIVIRAFDTDRLIIFQNMLQAFNKDFILVARNGIRNESYSGCKCKYIDDEFSSVISLTYINKNLVDRKYLPIRQNYNQHDNYTTIGGLFAVMPKSKISWVVPFSENLKSFFKKKDKNN